MYVNPDAENLCFNTKSMQNRSFRTLRTEYISTLVTYVRWT